MAHQESPSTPRQNTSAGRHYRAGDLTNPSNVSSPEGSSNRREREGTPAPPQYTPSNFGPVPPNDEVIHLLVALSDTGTPLNRRHNFISVPLSITLPNLKNTILEDFAYSNENVKPMLREGELREIVGLSVKWDPMLRLHFPNVSISQPRNIRAMLGFLKARGGCDVIEVFWNGGAHYGTTHFL